MDTLYSYNDWRDYALIHERKSQWTDENGRNTPAYNHKYYEEHREEIIKRVTENRRNSVNNKDLEENGRDITKSKFGTAYADENEKRDYINSFTNGTHLSEYASEMDEDFADQNSKHTEYSKDVLENVRKNNENVMKNIKNLTETVDKYLAANKGKLSQEQIAKLVKDTTQQIALEQKRLINLDSKEGKSYVDGLLKGGGKSSSKSSDSTKKTPSKSSSQSSSKPSNSSNSGSTSSKDTDKKSKKKTAIDELVDKYGELTPEERKKMKHSEDYTYNDWRYYLQHKAEKGKSKYDWSSGKNPPDYNHDYWEKNKEEILAQRAKKAGKSVGDVEKENIRDFGGSGIGYKSKKDGTDGTNLSDYENDDDWTDELTDEEKKNIDAHNKQVDENIANLKKTVEDYIAANKDKLGEEGIKKLRDNLQTQINIANEQRINTKNSDDYNYIMSLRKKNGESSKNVSSASSNSSAPNQTTAKNNTSKSSSSPSQSSNSKPKKTQEEMKQEEWERMTETKRKEAEEFAKQREATNKAKEDNFNYDNEEARRRKEEQERIRSSGRKTR